MKECEARKTEVKMVESNLTWGDKHAEQCDPIAAILTSVLAVHDVCEL